MGFLQLFIYNVYILLIYLLKNFIIDTIWIGCKISVFIKLFTVYSNIICHMWN